MLRPTTTNTATTGWLSKAIGNGWCHSNLKCLVCSKPLPTSKNQPEIQHELHLKYYVSQWKINGVKCPGLGFNIGVSEFIITPRAHARARGYVIVTPRAHARARGFRLVVQKLRRESAHARTFGGDFGLKILRMRGFSSWFLDNQPENCCMWSVVTRARMREQGVMWSVVVSCYNIYLQGLFSIFQNTHFQTPISAQEGFSSNLIAFSIP